ncbi:hypothetical protein E2C01_027496 [Portunus trituberculatus]|uniref:Uncharacterized protein n=1 Tax=Portunus trituberculatus TaxID=210409 RepID=A0A5B7ELB8_PORTR|nr:hypothetical protein [Portunus trituberculatus]
MTLRYLTYPEKKSDTLYSLQVLLVDREKVRNLLQTTEKTHHNHHKHQAPQHEDTTQASLHHTTKDTTTTAAASTPEQAEPLPGFRV